MHGFTINRSFLASCLLTATLLVTAGCIPNGDDGGDQTTLDWDAPLTRVDGSKLYPGEIQGYRVYYRRPDESEFRVHAINEANTTQWQPSSLSSGEYLFAVSTVDTSGLESTRSETLRVTIP